MSEECDNNLYFGKGKAVKEISKIVFGDKIVVFPKDGTEHWKKDDRLPEVDGIGICDCGEGVIEVCQKGKNPKAPEIRKRLIIKCSNCMEKIEIEGELESQTFGDLNKLANKYSRDRALEQELQNLIYRPVG